MQIQKIYSTTCKSVYFERKLTKEEEQDYKNNVIKPALDYLGVKEFAMILHGSSYPQSENDIKIGTPYGKVAAQLMPFELLHGFNSNQLGPTGELTSKQKISPYESSVGSKNYLFIDFDKLTQKEYGRLLTKYDIESLTGITAEQNKANYAYSNFPDAFGNYEYLINKAYENYLEKITNDYKKVNYIINLEKEYTDFCDKNRDKLNNSALYHVLKNHYGTDDFTKWDEIDKNLIKNIDKQDSQKRIIHLSQIYARDLATYKFAQFILDKQIKENTRLRKDLGFKYISDMLVGFSPADEWANQDLFLKDFRLGCPYGGPDGGLQKWGVPVLDPKKLFNQDGTLGEGGKLLKSKLDDCLTNFDNVRIDHVLGLIDPYIYSKDGSIQGNISSMEYLDPDKNYQKILNKIILPTLREHGLDKNSPVWEDTVTETEAFNRIYHYENNIPGLTPLEYAKGEPYWDSENWALVGSHDSDPANIMIQKDWIRENEAWSPMYLAGVLNAAHDSREYCQKIAQSDAERVKAKFAELFMVGDKVQMSFADFFGIDKTYNQGGNNKNPNNWKLRLNKDYESDYYKNLSSENPTAVNMPEVLGLAVKGQADMRKVKNQPDIPQEEIDYLLTKLARYEKILKEPEE